MAFRTSCYRSGAPSSLDEAESARRNPDSQAQSIVQRKSDSARSESSSRAGATELNCSGRSKPASDVTPLPARSMPPYEDAPTLPRSCHEAAHRLMNAARGQDVGDDDQSWTHDLIFAGESSPPGTATTRATPSIRYTAQAATTKSTMSLPSPSTMASSRDRLDSAPHSLGVPAENQKLYRRPSKAATGGPDVTPQHVPSDSNWGKSEAEVPTDVSEAMASDIAADWDSKKGFVGKVVRVSTSVRILRVLVFSISLLCIGIATFANEFISGRCWKTPTLDTAIQVSGSQSFTAGLSGLHFPGEDRQISRFATSSAPGIVCYHLSPVRWVPSVFLSWLNISILKKVDLGVGEIRRTSTSSFHVKFIKALAVRIQRRLEMSLIKARLWFANGFAIAADFMTPSDFDIPLPRGRLLSDRKAKISLSSLNTRITMMETSNTIQDALEHSTESLALREHNQQFVKRIEVVTDHMYVAIGYGLANVVLIDTAEGLILFDCLESPLTMKQLMNDWIAFRNNTGNSFDPAYQWGQKIIAIIYSHFHADHVFGAVSVFQPGITEIWAHETTNAEINKVFVMTAGTTYTRSMRQFGTVLTEKDGFINAGLGPRLQYGGARHGDEMTGVVHPTQVWSGDRKTVEIAGELFEFIFAAGESRDQTIAWLPRRKVLLGADNIYKSFPNIYAIRGTESRDAMIWVRSLDLMRSLRPEILVLGHTSPIRGAERIATTIQVYRDAIQFVHDQTVRYMNKGHPVDEVVSLVQLPSQLANHPYLQQFYGTVPWAVRAVFHHYVGWFSGRAEELHSLSTRDRGLRLTSLVGGWKPLLTHALNALGQGDLQWALELATAAQYAPTAMESATRVRILALRALAARQTSAPGRNWYLTAAKEDEEKIQGSKDECISEKLRISKWQRDQCIKDLKSPLEVFNFVPMRLRAERAPTIDLAINFTFTDTAETICACFRNGIEQSTADCERVPDLNVITTDNAWRRLVLDELNPFVAVATGQLRLKVPNPRDYIRLKGVMSLIERDV